MGIVNNISDSFTREELDVILQEMDKLLSLSLHSDKSKNPQRNNYKQLTFEQAVELRPGDHVYFITRSGNTVARARVTSVRTWKRTSGKCVIGLKYGLYEFFQAEYENGQAVKEQIVKQVG